MVQLRLMVLIPALLLGACGITTQRPRIGDTACLDRQVRDFHVQMYRAVTICGTPLPDLTGDSQLQLYADAWNMPYKINPVLDAELKRKDWSNRIQTGSHIVDGYDIVSSQLR